MKEGLELVTSVEAARRLGVSREDVAEAIREGRVKAIRVRFGHRVLELIDPGALEEFKQAEKPRNSCSTEFTGRELRLPNRTRRRRDGQKGNSG